MHNYYCERLRDYLSEKEVFLFFFMRTRDE